MPESKNSKLSKPSMELTKCSRALQATNEYTSGKCKRLVNKLEPCTTCKIKHKNWPQIKTLADIVLLNTGNNSSGVQLSSGSGNDPHWEVALGDTSGLSSVGSYSSAEVFQLSAWANSPNSTTNWISHNSKADHSGNEDYYYKLSFYLDRSISPNSFGLKLKYLVDNSLTEIYVNGNAQSQHYPNFPPQISGNSYSHGGYNIGNQGEIDLTNDWVECENIVIFHIKSGEPYAGFLAQFSSINCIEIEKPTYQPRISIKWGNRPADCLSLQHCETFCITVCNPYSNVGFCNFSIASIQIMNNNGRPLPIEEKEIAESRIEAIPRGVYCFGDIDPCSCVSREFIIKNNNAKPGKYKIQITGICYDVLWAYSQERCFELEICKG